MKTKIITIICIAITKLSFGQYQQFEQYVTPYLSSPIESGYFYFTTPNTIQAGQLYNWYKTNAPDLDNSMWLIDEHIDSLVNYKHFTYQQAYKNIPVEGAGCVEHYDRNGSLAFMHAKIADSINRDPNPKLNKEEVMKYLTQALLKENEKIQFAWNSEIWEKEIKIDNNDQNATWYPTPELIWAIDTMKNVQLVIPGNRFTLAYKISISFSEPTFETFIYFVDANNGNILKFYSTSICNGPSNIIGYGSRVIDTQWKGGLTQKYILQTNDNSRVIHTKKNPNGSTAWSLLSNTKDDDDNWGSSNDTECTAHYHVSNSWDYFRNTFSRTGQNNLSREIRVRSQWSDNNARFMAYSTGNHNDLLFGTTSFGGYYGAEPSVVAHEFTHGVTHHTSNLSYSYESGALNESFSDIFGTVIQAMMMDGGNTDWIHGNFVPNDIQKERSLKDPKSRGEHYDSSNILVIGQPDTYQGEYWYSGSGDNGGVHINSGVMNKWFYLLTEGEQGVNDLSDFYDIDGIGMTRAARIIYLAVTSNFLMSSSQYTDVRQATIMTAISIFGECSIEHQQTIDAWHAVGIGNLNSCEYTLGLDNLTERDLLIYPNPTSNILNIELPVLTSEKIQIFDIAGKLVQEFKTDKLISTTNLNNLQNGAYTIRFSFNGEFITKRFIVQK